MSEPKWISVGPRSSLGDGAMLGVEVGDHMIAVYDVEGELFATDNTCTHAFAMLTDGFLDGDIVECPLHGGCFNVKTGEGQGAPITEDIKTYPVRVVEDNIEVQVG
jgi:nitrite reductase/ring-hydroxylating ferredoxin subunit